MVVKKNKKVNAKLTGIRGSVLKTNEVANLIRNKSVSDAKKILLFSKKRVASHIHSCLNSAIANAENNNGLNASNLVVSEVFVGRDRYIKRFMPRGRGRSSAYWKSFSNISIFVSELN